MFPAYGAQTVHMPFGNVYTSLQTGVVDAAENGVNVYLVNKHYEVAPVLSMTEHEANNSFIWISDKLWTSLTAEQKGWVPGGGRRGRQDPAGQGARPRAPVGDQAQGASASRSSTDVDKSGFIKVADALSRQDGQGSRAACGEDPAADRARRSSAIATARPASPSWLDDRSLVLQRQRHLKWRGARPARSSC